MREQAYGRIVVTTSSSGLYGNFGQTNYGSAKMGVIGLMNTLAQEGAKYNIRINALAPTAGTRMTEGLIPEEAFALLTPETVTPAVLYMVSEDAPTKTIIAAGAGSFAVARIVESAGKWLPPEEQTPEGIAANWAAISSTIGENQPQAGFEQTVKMTGHGDGRPGPQQVGIESAARKAPYNGENNMREAVIVATARTPIGKAFRGGFNNLGGATLGAASVAEAVKRAGIDPARVEDVIMGSALQQGATGSNIARQIALRAGLPVTTSGMTMDRQCSSGLMAVATAAKQIVHDGMSCVVGGGLESISLVQNEHMNLHRMVDEELMAIEPNMFVPMLQTAEIVAKRYNISRDAMDEYGLQSQQRTAAAYAAGKYADELVAVTCKRTVWDKATGEASLAEATVSADEGLRATTAGGPCGPQDGG